MQNELRDQEKIFVKNLVDINEQIDEKKKMVSYYVRGYDLFNLRIEINNEIKELEKQIENERTIYECKVEDIKKKWIEKRTSGYKIIKPTQILQHIEDLNNQVGLEVPTQVTVPIRFSTQCQISFPIVEPQDYYPIAYAEYVVINNPDQSD